MAKSENLPFGIVEVAEDVLPAAPRKNRRDDERWEYVYNLLTASVGKWFQVNEYDNVQAAGLKAGQINNGTNKTFPNSRFAARYERNKEANTSVLFMTCHTAQASE